MRYSRGRVIALTILSVTMLLALFTGSILYNFRDHLFTAATGDTITDPDYIPTFDELYERIAFDDTDTGSTTLGQGTKLTLLEESYERGVLSSFISSNASVHSSAYSSLQNKRRTGYPYPVFTNSEMRSIANGMGSKLDIPIVMLDPNNYDDIVLFELTNLVDMPSDLIITRDGVVYENGVNLHALDNNYSADQVYAGVPTNRLTAMSSEIYANDGTTLLLTVIFEPDSSVTDGYVVRIRDTNGSFLYDSNAADADEVQTIENGSTTLYDEEGTQYTVVRNGNVVTVRDVSNNQLKQVEYTTSDHQLTSYEIGGVAYNANALRGMFREQGVYEISFKQKISMGDGVKTTINVSFAFAIVNKAYYKNSFPRFNTDNRVSGYGEIYNYSYESEYPTVSYSNRYFDVQIVTTAQYDADTSTEIHELRFYNIGAYQMVSTLRYYSSYLYSNRQTFNKRGAEDGYLTLSRYSKYSSTLNILGFQAYYGGQHADSKYAGPLPFYDNEDSTISSDISAWVRNEGMTAEESGSVADYQNMRVSDALQYVTELANYITTDGSLKPVRTNFPPVRIMTNEMITHSTGAGTNGEEKVVLSSVAFRPAYGTGNTREWTASTFEVGAPFEEAGEYVVTVYFKVNDEICQQTFYFEIVNAAKIAFEITANGETNTYYAGELELNQDLHDLFVAGTQVKLTYDGETTLGQFEVLPTITLAYAEFGEYTFVDQNIAMGDNGSFAFNLQPGQYRLTIKYGAHGKSTTVFSIIVDDTLATGITANTSAKSLADTVTNLPEDIAIVGAGDVTLTWDNKKSEIGFNNVVCEYYEMSQNKGTDPNSASNYTHFPDDAIANLFSTYIFSTSITLSDSYQPVQTEDGWTLSETFTAAGLYRFTLVDDVGNQTPFVLIIDNSTPTFTQSGDKPTQVSNMVTFDDDGIKIGFGTSKWIGGSGSSRFNGTLYQDIFSKLKTANILVTSGTTRVISIPLVRVEYSDSGDLYQDVSAEDLSNGYMILNEEGTFYFRVTDALGNVGEYYIILTHDNCFGTVYAESSAPTISTADAYKSYGMILAEPTANTSLVNSMGGMTNRSYVTFSFNQKGSENGNTTFRVESVYLQYYPLTYDVTSANYPFAEYPDNNPYYNGYKVFANQDNDKGLIYTYNASRDKKDTTIRLALFNTETITPAGMYILTRVYNAIDSGSDTMSRDYYFIVDRENMLYYADDYQTALKIHFAETQSLQSPKAKDADATVIYENNNALSSNRTAWVSGFNSKYSWKHDSTTYTIINDAAHFNHLAFMENDQLQEVHSFNFPTLAPRFSYINNNQITNLGEGAGTWAVGDPASRTDDTIYKLLITDNARSISCMLIDGNIFEIKSNSSAPTSANWDYLTLNLDTEFGTRAEITLDENKTVGNSRMEYDGDRYLCIVDSSDITQLKLSFKSDPESMYADVNLEATAASWTWIENGVTQSVVMAVPTPVNGVYTFDLMNDFLADKSITNGASLSVSLITYDDTHTDYTILFDRYKPSYNLNMVKAGDNLACTMTELPGTYIYGLSSDFVFKTDQVNNPYLDTKVITYREIPPNGEGSQAAVRFNLANGNDGIPFATLVGLRDNEMKYYYITETDYAGHITEYKVQIQGANYVNAITFIGATSEEGDEIQIGVEMHASSSSVHQFFVYNNAFRFESGDEYYMVLGSQASWHIGNETDSGLASEENLINALNSWINAATEKGEKCSYTLYDRIGDVEVFEFYNLREGAEQMQLDCYQTSTSSNFITLEVTNLKTLPLILLDDALTSYFKIEVEDKTSAEKVSNVYFSLYGTSIPADVSHELVIKVTDPFGRTSTTEYHQQIQSTINFTAYGNTVTKDGVTYVGDERGVDFSYLRTVYTVLIYDANTNELLSNLDMFIDGNDMINYSFRPVAASATVEKYRIVATGRASGAILFDQTFAFDTRLPVVEWKNASDQIIDVEGQSFVSAVIFDISKNDMTNYTFPVTVSYTRTLNNHVESVTLQPVDGKITFYQEGSYVVTVRNTVWAKETYKFEIVKIDDTLVLVYDDGKQIEASTSDYKYTDKETGEVSYITRYVFATAVDTDVIYPVNEYEMHGLEIKLGQTNRILAGDYEAGTDYYDYDAPNSTIIWRLAFLTSTNADGEPNYTSPIYFATTGVSTVNLSEDNSISLQLNGNPNNPTDNTLSYTVVASHTAYNIVYENYMTAARGKKLTVQLYCDKVKVSRDENDVPYYLQKGNLIKVDCYYNGSFIRTMDYDETFTINANDAGYYEFTVHDLVGNYLYFGDSEDENDVNYRQTRYLLVVLTKPVVVINDKQAVSGMIYNDQVELKLVDYGTTFLNRYYAGEVANDEQFFNNYFRVTEMEVTYTGSDGTTTTRNTISKNQTSFYWNQSGSYRVSLTYRIYGAGSISTYLTADYAFQIVPSKTIRESFSMPIYPDIPVLEVTRDDYTIHDYNIYVVTDGNDKYMNFDANSNPGSYVVTLQAYNSIIQDYVIHEVQFNIQHKANSASTYFVLSSASGTATTSAVTLYYNPYWLYLSQGQVTITLSKDYVVQQEITVDSSILANDTYGSQELFTVSDAGLYRVSVRDAEGDVVYSDSWTIEATQSTFGYIILAVVMGIAGVGLLLFIRMRNRMTTK